MSGRLLDVNLDSVVFMKFIDLCRRVCVLQTILAMCMYLPLNWTAWCYKNRLRNDLDGKWEHACGTGANNTYALSNM